MNYLKRRYLTYLVIFFIALNLDFLLPRIAPGNAAVILASNTKFSAESAKPIVARLGLDKPIQVQYFDFLKNIFATWPPYFGVSYGFPGQTVTGIFFQKLPWTLILILSSLALSIVLAYGVTAITSLRRGGKAEAGSLYTSVVFHAIPLFWIGMIFIYVFGVWLNWAPIYGNVGFEPGTGLNYVSAVVVHAILPVTVLTLAVFGHNYILLRASTQEVLRSDYVTAAKTRGLKGRLIATRYILRNSMLPLVSILSFSMANLLSLVCCCGRSVRVPRCRRRNHRRAEQP